MCTSTEQWKEIGIHIKINMTTTDDVIIEPAAAFFIPEYLMDCLLHTSELLSTMLST